MIHKFKVKNFYSINEEQELDFTSNKQYSESSSEFDDIFVNNVNCFVGANASGKTNIFKALSFLIWFAEKSYYEVDENFNESFTPHKLNNNKPTSFEIIFDSDKKLYKYSVNMTKEKLLYECLEIKSTKGFSYLYKLKNTENEIQIKYNRNNKHLPPINENDEKRFKSKEKISFLSFLLVLRYLNNIKLTGIVPMLYSNVSRPWSKNVDSDYDAIILSKALNNKAILKDGILPYLKCFDLGISDFSEDELFKVKDYNGEYVNLLGFKHSNSDKSFIVSAVEESSGTIKAVFLLVILLAVLSDGGAAIVDELDTKLHYDIARKLISLFSNKDTNKKNAQLFFSTHQPLFLNDRDKTQIFLCYKEDCLNTEIYRLDDIQGIRNTEYYFEKYLAG